MNTYSGHSVRQQSDEVNAFIKLLLAEDVRAYLEIGACHGDTFHAVMSALPKGSKGVAVDLPESTAKGKTGPRAALKATVADLNAKGYDASVIFGDSTSVGVQQLAMVRGLYDAVLVDGKRHYEVVAKDWLAYGPMARIVAFHGVDADGQITKNGSMQVEVSRLWREIKSLYCNMEIIGHQRGMGIGVLWQ